MPIDQLMLREALELTIRARDRLVAALDGGASSGTQQEAAETGVLISKIGDTFFSHMRAAPGLCGIGRSREEAEKAILPAQIGLLKSDPDATPALTPYDHIRRADALLHAAYDTPCNPGDEAWHKQQAHGLIHDAAAHLSPRADARAAVRKEAEDRERALILKGLERASELVGGAAWRHEGGDAYSQGMDAGARHQVNECVKAIDAEIASLRAERPPIPSERDSAQEIAP